MQDAFLTMKSKKKLDLLMESFDTLKKLLIGDKTLVDILDLLSGMMRGFVDKILVKKRKFKQEVRETGEKLRGELQTLETQLFTTKVETETLKIDKKYFEDQVNELQKKNQEMISNIENIMSDPKRGVPGATATLEKRPSDALLPKDVNLASQSNLPTITSTTPK